MENGKKTKKQVHLFYKSTLCSSYCVFASGKGALLTRYRPRRERQLYEGDFERGFRHGFGVLAYENEDHVFLLEYRGNWKRVE